MVTQMVPLGSVNARGLVDIRYSKAGTSLGCPRLTAIDARLRGLYQAAQQKEHGQYISAQAVLKTLQEKYIIESENMLTLSVVVLNLIDPDDFLQPDLASHKSPVEISLQHPLAWSGLRLIKQYDDLMLLIQFLFSTGGLRSPEPHEYARKLRERAGRPVRRFLTEITKELANAGFSS